MSIGSSCSIEQCRRSSIARGWCGTHYARWRRNGGDPTNIHRQFHWQTHHPLYRTYAGMMARCYNQRHIAYFRYGGRGIGVFEPWRKDIRAFIEYMEDSIGPKPSRKHTLDRIDNDGDYEPGNIQWSDYSQQATNRRPMSYNSLNTSGCLGVSYDRTNGKWTAKFTRGGQLVWLGRHDTFDKAKAAVTNYLGGW
jgi:hypothetical protein